MQYRWRLEPSASGQALHYGVLLARAVGVPDAILSRHVAGHVAGHVSGQAARARDSACAGLECSEWAGNWSAPLAFTFWEVSPPSGQCTRVHPAGCQCCVGVNTQGSGDCRQQHPLHKAASAPSLSPCALPCFQRRAQAIAESLEQQERERNAAARAQNPAGGELEKVYSLVHKLGCLARQVCAKGGLLICGVGQNSCKRL